MNRAIRTTIKHVRRSPFQAVAASLVLTITFFLVSVFSLVTAGSEKVIRYFETRPQVTAFLKDEATPEDVTKLKNQIRAIGSIEEIGYISKDDALAIYQEQNKNDPLLLEMVTADILPASLEISATTPDILAQVAKIMASNDSVEEVVYQQNIINALLSWTRAVRISGLGLVSFLLLSSITTVIIIISMKITNRRTEIEIMRLLGASQGHVLAPFLLEGIFYGVIGSFIGWGVSYILLLYSTPFILTFFGSIPLLPVSFWSMLLLLGAQLTLGSLVGLLSSLFATRRFLK